MRAAPASALHRFSSVAGLAVAVLVGTGVVQAVRLDGGPAALLSGADGRLLLAKVALMLPMLWMAKANRENLRGSAESEPDGAHSPAVVRAMKKEFVLGVAILGVTASLVVTPPSTDQTAAHPLMFTTCSTSTSANGASLYCG